MDAETIHWIKSTLHNDEEASDEEMLEYFVKEGGLAPEVAAQWVALRPRYRVELFCDAEPEGSQMKDIVESWEDPDGGTYAIVQYQSTDVALSGKLFEVGVWDKEFERLVPVGIPAKQITSAFNTFEEARDYLLWCICEQDLDPDIWISLLQPGPRRLPTFKGYTVDQRLGEFRKANYGQEPEFIPFESSQGRKLLAEMRQARTKGK